MNVAASLHQQGLAFYEARQYTQALEQFDRCLALDEAFAEAWFDRARTLRALSRYDEALAAYDAFLALKPGHPVACNNQGNLFQSLGRYSQALECYEQAIAASPDYVPAYVNRGVVLHRLNRDDDALAAYGEALARAPHDPTAHNNLGVTLHALGRDDEALAHYEAALGQQPGYAEAWCNRGDALHTLKRFPEAQESYANALKYRPDYAEAFNNLGTLLRDQGRAHNAAASYRNAIACQHDYAEAYANLGDLLRDMKDYDASVAALTQAARLKPSAPDVLGTLYYTKMLLSDWDGTSAILAALERELDTGNPVSAPFAVAASPLSLATLKRCAELSVKACRATARPVVNARTGRERIRVGYFSADFQRHATAYLTAGLFEAHDRSAFEVIGFSYGPPSQDPMRARLEKAFDQFIDISALTDKQAAERARALGVDIAVDLKGFTRDARIGIFANRAAPVQVSYLGYPGTMGADFFDYLIADETVIPSSHRKHYTESIVFMPDSYQVNDDSRVIGGRHFTRAQAGLPEKGFVFCCFNNSYKISPDLFAVWMRLLHAVPESVLWLLESNPPSAANLRAAARAQGIEANRLVFAPRMELADHLARHRLADLFLDCFHYNAHTTASDALWAGLPVLTCLGETFASRVGASLLKAVGLPELITTSPASYEARALELAGNPAQLAEIRQTLAANRKSAPLFDTRRFTRHLEDAYRRMIARLDAGETPEDLRIPPASA